MRKATRIATALLVGASLTLALVGCTSKDHISARLHNGLFEITACDSTEPNRIQVQVKPSKGDARGFVVAWNVDGKAKLGAGTHLTYGMPPKGFTTTSGPAKLDLARVDLYVALESVDSVNREDVFRSRSATFQGSQLAEDHWLNWDGQRVTHPC